MSHSVVVRNTTFGSGSKLKRAVIRSTPGDWVNVLHNKQKKTAFLWVGKTGEHCVHMLASEA